MQTRHSAGALQALYRVFIQPALNQATQPSRYRLIKHSTTSHYCVSSQLSVSRTTRSFATTSRQQVKTREPEVRNDKWDNEIRARLIYLVNPETNQLYTLPQPDETVPPETAPPSTRYDVLSRIDRNTHRLVQFANQEGEDEPDFIPVCKVVSKKAVYAADRRRKDQQKEKKKTEAASKSVKTLELNWAIDPNDLGHRLEKAAGFLAEGRKVEIVLASKKRGRKASESECEEVLQKIRKTVESVPGSKETKGMEGKLGAFVMLSYQGKMQQQAKEGG